MNTTDFRREKLEALIKEYKESGKAKSVAALARMYDLDTSYISQLRKGYSSFGESAARNLETKMGLPHRYFEPESEEIFQIQSQSQNGQMQTQSQSQKYQSKRNVRYVPIRGKAQMGANGYWLEYDYPPGYGDGYVIVENASDKAYAIEGAGMSMYPAIRSGWIVVFEPEKPLCSGEFVHIGLTDGQRMIKELISYQNGVLNVLSVNGDERLSFDESEIEFINSSKSIYPPSAVVHDLPEVE